MYCEVCKAEPATVFITQIVDGKVHKVDMCQGCAKEKDINDPTSFDIAGMLLGLGESKPLPGGGVEGRCPKCNFTEVDFKRMGRLGCEQCYMTFSDSVMPMIRGMHKGQRHTGKAPKRLREKMQLDSKRRDLRGQLDAAVSAENYEEAARLRDEIAALDVGGVVS
jgi:protein arginine kinase activator